MVHPVCVVVLQRRLRVPRLRQAALPILLSAAAVAAIAQPEAQGVLANQLLLSQVHVPHV
jgi:hypothetical protein